MRRRDFIGALFAAPTMLVEARAQPDRLVPDHPDTGTAVAMAAALRLSGLPRMEPNLQSRLSAAGADPTLRVELANLPPRLEELHVVTPTHLDVLWGASVASGDDCYVRMIADFFATTANHSELIAVDVAKTALAISGGPRDVLAPMHSSIRSLTSS
jgi:hypothetical protein